MIALMRAFVCFVAMFCVAVAVREDGASRYVAAADISDRDTQSPLVWLKLRKSVAKSTPANSYEEYAGQRVGELRGSGRTGTY